MHLWPDIDRAGCRDFRVGLTSAEPALSATARHRLGSSIAECHLLQPVSTHSFYCFATGWATIHTSRQAVWATRPIDFLGFAKRAVQNESTKHLLQRNCSKPSDLVN